MAGKWCVIWVIVVSVALKVLMPVNSFPDGIKIDSIRFKGNKKIEARTLKKTISSREGGELDYGVIKHDVKKIFEMGYFSDVKVDADFREKGVALTFLVEEKPVVYRVEIKGNEEVPKEQILEAITVKENDFFSDAHVKESKKNILEVYSNNGILDSSVNVELIEMKGGRLKVLFNITEGEKKKISSIVFKENNFFNEKALKKVMKTNEKGFFSWLTGSGKFKKDVFQQDLKMIELTYLDNGFLDVKVLKPEITRDERGLKIVIHIIEGKQYRVGKVEVKGTLPEQLKDVSEDLKTRPYEIFSREKMVRDILLITRKLQDLGFADGNVVPGYRKMKKYPVVDIILTVNRGKKYRFGLVNVSGNTKTMDKVVRRNLAVSDGELYTISGLEESRANLMKLGYFKDVRVKTEKGEKDNELDVNVEIEEGPTGTVSGGVGFSSVDKVFGTVQISEKNFLGRGWNLGLNAQVGSRRVIFNLNFTEPNLMDSMWSFNINLYNSDVEFTDFTRKSKGGRIGFGYPILKNTTTGFSLRIDKVSIQDVGETVQNSVLKEEEALGPQRIHSIGWNIKRNTTDSFINPTIGSVQDFSVEYAGGPLGGDLDFVQYFVGAKYFKPVTDWAVLGFNFLWGHTINTVGGRVRLSERFFLGGPYSIRGFESRSISPVDGNTGEQIGGNKELVINYELVTNIYKEFGLKWVFFFDMGNTFRQDDWPTSFSDLRYGAGFGLRWYSPMGPLRFEWGFNLDPEPGESKRVVEFTIGNAF